MNFTMAGVKRGFTPELHQPICEEITKKPKLNIKERNNQVISENNHEYSEVNLKENSEEIDEKNSDVIHEQCSEVNSQVNSESNSRVNPEENSDVIPDETSKVNQEEKSEVNLEVISDVNPEEENSDVNTEANSEVKPEENSKNSGGILEQNNEVIHDENSEVNPEENCDVSHEENIDVTAGTSQVNASLFERLEPSDEFPTIVDICLKTIVAPLLREYIKPVTEGLYNSLVQQHKINIQTIPDILSSYNCFKLQYQWINGNNQVINTIPFNRGRQGSNPNWDYKVGGAVDLTKLFLSRISQFTDFCDCDLLEVLNIMEHIDTFPVQVRQEAMELRRDVRKPVAHHNPTEWTEEKFESSFDKMQNIVNSLDIDAERKRRTVSEIEKKKRRRCILVSEELCFFLTFRQGNNQTTTMITRGLKPEEDERTIENFPLNTECGSGDFGIKRASKSSVKLDLTADEAVFRTVETFKMAVHKLLDNIIKYSGVKKNECACLDVEFILPKTLTQEQLDIVSKAFPGALDAVEKEPPGIDSKAVPGALKAEQKGQHNKKDVATDRNVPKELTQQLHAIQDEISTLAGNLDKNKKRWITIGIALHSVLSPVLRKYVATSLGQLYETLKKVNNIDIQQYPHQLPSCHTSFLNYEAINNNRDNWKRQRNRYDYCVKGPVDLSKLFLQTHMTHYSAFDEGCDSSALLGIIIGTSPYAEASARQVRSEIRNAWAHCNFSQWDETKYTESFLLIDGLVRRLGLTRQEENVLCLQLYRIQRNGMMFIEETASFEILAEMKKNMQSMVEHLDETRLNLYPTKTEMEAANERLESIEKRLENLEERLEKKQSSIPKHMKEKYQIHMNAWKKDDETFTDTRATKRVTELIETDNIVIVTGSSGSGKSSIIHHVALQLESEQNFEVIPFVLSPIDIIQYRDVAKNQLFIIDDLCGKNFIDEMDLLSWKNHSNSIEALFPSDSSRIQSRLKILVSCRSKIFNDKKFEGLKLFTKHTVDLQSETYTLLPEEKHKMIERYTASTIPDYRWEKINTMLEGCHYFPLLCKLSKGKELDQLTFLLESSPIDIITKDLNKIIVSKSMESVALVFCVLFVDGFHEDFIDPTTRPQNVEKIVNDVIGIFKINLAHKNIRAQLLEAFNTLDGTYVKKTGQIYSISHAKLYDIVGVVCYSKLPSYGWTPLSAACIDGNKDQVKLLLDADVNPQQRYPDRWNSLLAACYYGHREVVELLLDRGVDPSMIESAELTPLIAACSFGHEKIVELLLDKGVDLSQGNRDGWTPLMAASSYGHRNIVNLLLKRGADPLQKDLWGRTYQDYMYC